MYTFPVPLPICFPHMNHSLRTLHYLSPLGTLRIDTLSSGEVIGMVRVEEHSPEEQTTSDTQIPVQELNEYFSGTRKTFSVPIQLLEGSTFEQKVWRGLLRIPYGETVSYKNLALLIGHPNAFRAVGTALSKNPIPIILPCHRVVKSDGSLGEFGWGREWKEYLLGIEKSYSR